MKFFVVSDPESRVRVCVDQGEDEPPFMRSISWIENAKGLEFAATSAAVRAAPSCSRDAEGFLFWATESEAKIAAVAASAAVIGRR